MKIIFVSISLAFGAVDSKKCVYKNAEKSFFKSLFFGYKKFFNRCTTSSFLGSMPFYMLLDRRLYG